MIRLIGILTAIAIMFSALGTRAATIPERVTFPSADGRTMLIGYLFAPARHGVTCPKRLVDGTACSSGSADGLRKVCGSVFSVPWVSIRTSNT